ncbi:hypothetical protein RFI_27696 [Reticulomyxa filosa]|uniref:PDZ domain-containing protein n=1 Tax=Reticulomyxa filosa TaxID=46433 RepID=X6M7Q2_RETFI|nr:hypothetical protein RFI_27696 [Reticulomyxa filosa]|eukprot:ETO09681.1 hypothetical protein RFI_27696 [Reticulomyxa filosa]
MSSTSISSGSYTINAPSQQQQHQPHSLQQHHKHHLEDDNTTDIKVADDGHVHSTNEDESNAKTDKKDPTAENSINAYICAIEPNVPFELFEGSMVVSINGKDVIGMPCHDIVATLDHESLPIRLELVKPRNVTSPRSPRISRGSSVPAYDQNGQMEEEMLKLKEEAERKLQKKSFWSNVFTRR